VLLSLSLSVFIGCVGNIFSMTFWIRLQHASHNFVRLISGFSLLYETLRTTTFASWCDLYHYLACAAFCFGCCNQCINIYGVLLCQSKRHGLHLYKGTTGSLRATFRLLLLLLVGQTDGHIIVVLVMVKGCKCGLGPKINLLFPANRVITYRNTKYVPGYN
jgi:hypothetical protein